MQAKICLKALMLLMVLVTPAVLGTTVLFTLFVRQVTSRCHGVSWSPHSSEDVPRVSVPLFHPVPRDWVREMAFEIQSEN